jgi:nitronate monooxygenase
VQSTLPFITSVVDALAKRAPDLLVLAAGGIVDGRGLAAVLMLGADGVVMGTRFRATKESLIPDAAKAKALTAEGQRQVRTSVCEIVNNRTWPPGYTGRVIRSPFVEKWHAHEAELKRVREEKFEKVEQASWGATKMSLT